MKRVFRTCCKGCGDLCKVTVFDTEAYWETKREVDLKSYRCADCTPQLQEVTP